MYVFIYSTAHKKCKHFLLYIVFVVNTIEFFILNRIYI